MSKMKNSELQALLAGWSDSEFAAAASGEYAEDLKATIEGVLSRDVDMIQGLLNSWNDALEAAALIVERYNAAFADPQAGGAPHDIRNLKKLGGFSW